ncbi:trafficking protein particle complex subunit 6A isoform X10 [Symphalangus syndactylus]|uniref:trafficking protein particle complex subunit 6A isoform X10 n=1 Tax=Symphalangus syndactylus TaxID=9590 RepID=UPI003004081E
MRAGSAGRIFRRARGCMADTVLFEFLHTEMVAELWAHDPDPGSGGQKMSLSVLEGMGFRVGQALGESLALPHQAAPGDAGLQGGAGCPQVLVQRPVGGRVPEADGQPAHQSPVPGLHLRPPARRPLYPGHRERGHRLRGSPARL